jgi:hypothetical protein
MFSATPAASAHAFFVLRGGLQEAANASGLAPAER